MLVIWMENMSKFVVTLCFLFLKFRKGPGPFWLAPAARLFDIWSPDFSFVRFRNSSPLWWSKQHPWNEGLFIRDYTAQHTKVFFVKQIKEWINNIKIYVLAFYLINFVPSWFLEAFSRLLISLSYLGEFRILYAYPRAERDEHADRYHKNVCNYRHQCGEGWYKTT